jgi:Mg2+-importing ATPase
MDILLILAIKDQPTGNIQTLWFATSAIAEVLFIYSVRTKKAFYKSKPKFILIFTTITAIALILFFSFIGIPAIPFENILSINLLSFVLFVSLLYFIMTETGKLILIKLFDEKDKKHLSPN